MRPITDNKYGGLQEDPVSPLSYRSDEGFPTNGEVSPLTSKTRPQPPATGSTPQYRPRPEIYKIAERKSVSKSNVQCKGTVANGRLAMHDSSPNIFVLSDGSDLSSEAREKSGRRPRSQSVRTHREQEMFVVPRSPQDHADHTRATLPNQGATVSTTSGNEPRSQSVPPATRHRAIPLERRICAHVSYDLSLNFPPDRPH